MKNALWSRLSSIDTNRVLALAAVFISFCALFVSIQEVRIMREQQWVSMYPYLSLSQRYSSEGFGLHLKNSGTGPALINAIQLTDGERYFNSWLEVSNSLLPDSLSVGYDLVYSNSINDQIISPDESIRLFFLPWNSRSRLIEERSRELTLSICYSSLLGDSWELVNDTRTALDEACEKIPERELR